MHFGVITDDSVDPSETTTTDLDHLAGVEQGYNETMQ